MNDIRSISLTALMALGVAWPVAEAQRELVGRWTLDPRQSQLSGRMATNATSIAQALQISIDTAGLHVTTETGGGRPGQYRATEHYVADSTERPFQPTERVDSRGSTGTRRSWWMAAARELVVTERVERTIGGQRFTAVNTHGWKLSATGDTLVINSRTDGPRGSIPTRRAFLRAR
jgi:hypothetical protein